MRKCIRCVNEMKEDYLLRVINLIVTAQVQLINGKNYLTCEK